MSLLRQGSWFRHNESWQHLLIRYSSAILIAAGAIGLRLLLDERLGHSGFAILLAGMIVAAWVGGVGPSLIAQTIILFAHGLWFSPTHEVHSPFTAEGIVSLIAFYGVGIAVAGLSEAWHAARMRERAEKNEAIAQREHFQATLACVGDGVLVTDAEGRLTLMNHMAEEMIGWKLTESKGKPARDVFVIYDEQTQEPIENPVQNVLRRGQVLHETMRLILTTRKEHQLPVAYSAAPIHDASGKTIGVVLIIRDETERRRAEIAQRTADQRKDEFLATLAHELRNPLAPICMGLELMKISPRDNGSNEEVRSMMERQTHHMVRLIDDLLDVSRITRGKLELRRRQVRLDEVVRNAVDATRPAIDEAGHSLEVALPENPILLDADPNRLTQILSNLLNNAAKYTPHGGRIELTADQCDGEVTVAITDNGRGIPAEMLEQIFEMFTQVRGSDETVQTGLGIGLTLVKRLVELHGGSVRVESEGENQGSRFCVRLPGMRLPAASKESLIDGAAAYRPQSGTGRRVLIVDDNEDALSSLSFLVRVLGNEICRARDGLEAIAAAERFRPEIVLMDIGMPNLNGYEAAKRIRAEPWGEQMLLVATTGWGQEEDRRRSKDAGFDRHLVKPIEPEKLRELLAAPLLTGVDGRAAAEERGAERKSAGSAADGDTKVPENSIEMDRDDRFARFPK
ncbi:MAG TPA: ATP-binding protein [Lacipirellulaceae bacterium]|nr:ATP-binding protein [Lacipirellulaceae bacterium]